MTLAKLRRGFEIGMEVLVVFLLLSLAGIVLLGVGFRVFGDPLPWYDEIASVLLAWLTYYGAALAAVKRAHIGCPSLVDNLPVSIRFPLVVLAEVCVLGFFILLAWYGWVILDLLAGDTLVSVPVPVEVTQSVIPVGAALFVIAELLVLPQVLRAALTGRPQPHEEFTVEVSQ